MGAPSSEIRRALGTGGLSTLVSPCQYHHDGALSKPGGIRVSKNILTNISIFYADREKLLVKREGQ